MSWDGVERRKGYLMEHGPISPECVQIFKRLDDKLDTLIDRANKVNGRYEKHMDESLYYRSRIERHDEKLKLLTWLFGILTVPIIFLMMKVIFK